MNELKDNFIKEKWKMTLANLNSEIAHTHQIYESCKAVKNSKFDCDNKNFDSEISYLKQNSNNNIVMVPFSDGGDKKKRMPNLDHFGGRLPFQNERQKTDPLEILNDNIDMYPLKNIFTENKFKKEVKGKDYIRINKKSTTSSNKVVNHIKTQSKNDFDKESYLIDKKNSNILDYTMDLDSQMDFAVLKHTNSNLEKHEPLIFEPVEEKNILKSIK
jgi:hypothetical protein